ncbi:hypothetical protein F2Q68_00012216 [Brassica cretica]|uniref:Uncharacterized protein n=1 Tax=Brassica cretica TaxID=69181 RepID=A0A3N6Q5Y2_BRACR|nr:hypothetical protein F2Q68_00012216 [Brassica cretica]
MASFNATHGLELIDQRSFAKPDRFKLHPFIFVLLRRGRRPWLVRTTLWTCFVFFVHLRHRLKTKPPRTSLSQASVSQITGPSPSRLSLPTLSCLDSSLAVVLILPSLSRYGRDLETMAISYVLQHKPSNLWIFSSWSQYFQVYNSFTNRPHTFRFYISSP